jgi:3',5'-cyclic AMP phosphodiesterase CpdA
MSNATTTRLAHVSDVHIAVPEVRWRLRDWCSKRLTGWINYRWSRRQRFAAAETVLTALVADIAARQPDTLVFSGDASALGFAAEIERAAQLLRVGELPGLAIPGNHDYYIPHDEWSGCFERVFAPWLTGERIAARTYPFARRVGHVWLVAVNAAHGQWLPWEASGRVGREQLDRLEQLLGRLAGGPRILVVHFPVAKANGLAEAGHHGLRDLADLLGVAKQGGIGLWLHGHLHRSYHLNDPRLARFPIVCAGSGTERGRAGYLEYAITGQQVRAVRRVHDPASGRFTEAEAFELTMPASGETAVRGD